MAQNLQTPPPKSRNAQQQPESKPAAEPSSSTTPSPSNHEATSPFRTTPSQGIRRPGAKIPSPLPLTSPARNNGPVSPLNTRTPLSASHPIPETPLKLSQRGGPQTPATPHYPIYPHHSHSHSQDGDAARASGLGLGLTPLKQPVPLAPSPDNVRSPLNDALHLRGRAASNASIGSPLKSGRSDIRGEPLALGSSSSSGSQGGSGQIDAMLDRLRNTRSGLGTSASMWAPKPAANDSNNASSSSSSTSTTSHTIGSGFSSSNLLGVQTGLDRKRPSHRPNGLQLSLGQEISVMQELAEGAEEDYPTSNVSSATVGETFRIDPPADDAANGDQEPWQGTVVPPTPSLGCDSPSSDDDASGAAKAPARSLDAFGWGSHGNNEPRRSSLFSNLPSSSTLEANWSGDDDDDRKDDVEVFEERQRAAKASNKEKRNGSYAPLPPLSLNFAKSRTPSPTHHGLLAKSPQLDGPADSASSKLPTSPSLGGAPKLGALPAAGDASAAKSTSQRLSPVSTRSQLPSEDSEGDADVETEKPKSGRERKPSKKHELKNAEHASKDAEDIKADSLQVNARGLEKKRSLKRDKSGRIRGRRASQSKEKDVDKVKMTASAPPAPSSSSATVSLPTASFKREDEDLAQSIQNVSLNEESKPQPAAISAIASKPDTHQQQTPIAQRVQSIPTVKDDLFSSPAEPKVDLPGIEAKVEVAAPASAEEEKEEKKESEKTPESTHAKTMSFDWAADDDELDDELPDLDDWGVTLTPAKPSSTTTSTSANEADVSSHKGAEKQTGGNGKPKAEESNWRRGELLKSKPSSTADRKASGKGNGRELFPPKPNDGVGIRIAGRAKSASLSPEPEASPASTPYGRWNKPTSTANEKQGVSIKGTAGAARKSPTRPKKDSTAQSARPRIAADLGALAKLIAPEDPPPNRSTAGGKQGSRKNSLAIDRGEDLAAKSGKKEPSVRDSSVGDSMHAPSKNASGPRGGGGGGATRGKKGAVGGRK